MEDNLCRCNATPVAGSSAVKVPQEEEYFPPRIATPPGVPGSSRGVLVPIYPTIGSSRMEIADDVPVDRAESRVDRPLENVVSIPMVATVSVASSDLDRI